MFYVVVEQALAFEMADEFSSKYFLCFLMFYEHDKKNSVIVAIKNICYIYGDKLVCLYRVSP